ncbi:MAG: methyltransferase domain-containing protein [bacterium]
MRIKQLIRVRGIGDVTYFAGHYFINKLRSLRKATNYQAFRKNFKGKSGLEIGGPSKIFTAKGQLPIYDTIKGLDNVNYSTYTVWTGKIVSSEGFKVGQLVVGKEFILGATDLSKLKKGLYDFVISSNNFEHLANPLQAIKQFVRVTRSGGLLLIITPRKESNFDHRRQIVSFGHLLDDYKHKVLEDDLTHFQEIIHNHDLKLDLAAGNRKNFLRRSRKNLKYRCLHHHVFDLAVLKKIFRFFGIKVIFTAQTHTDYIILGRIPKGIK